MKTDITYILQTKNRKILCIDEVNDDKVIHHSNGVYFLMDNPNDEEVKVMEGFGRTEHCSELVQSMKKDETQHIQLNGYDVEITVKSICEGGLF